VSTPTLDTILGRCFAASAATEQAELLNAAGYYAEKTYEREWYIEMQACRIADRLDESGWRWIREIMKFDPKAAKP
jgi:hypothetical protein